MSIGAIKDRENSKFLESPLRGDPNAAVEVVVSETYSTNPEGVLVTDVTTGIATNLSTSTPLVATDEYISAWVDVAKYSSAGVTIYSDQSCGHLGLRFHFSSDGVNVDEEIAYNYTNGNGKSYALPLFTKYFRIRYLNSVVDQTILNIQTKLYDQTLAASSQRINDAVINEDDAQLVKAVLSGQDSTGSFQNIKSSGSGNMLVAIGQRPSQVKNRVKASGYIEHTILTSTPSIVHTVTPGTTLFITSFILTAFNTAAVHGIFTIQDDTVVVVPFVMPDRVSGTVASPFNTTSPSLPDPIEIADSLTLAATLGTIEVSFYFIGYEEPNTYVNAYSMLFDGVDEYVTLSNPASLNLTINVSISAWFKTTNVANNKCIIGKYGATGPDRSYFIELVGTTNVIRVYIYGAGGVVKDYSTPTGGYNDGLWHNVLFTFETDDLKLYVDGVLIVPTKTVDNTVPSININSSDTLIGALPVTVPENYFIGNIDEVSVISKAITQGGVTALYNNGVPNDLREASFSSKLISFYRMGDAGNFPTISDFINGNNGTAVNMETGDQVLDVPS